jgi:hypothetical protein
VNPASIFSHQNSRFLELRAIGCSTQRKNGPMQQAEGIAAALRDEVEHSATTSAPCERSGRLRQYRVPRRSRERDRVEHVGEAGDVGEGALEAEAEAGVRHRAVAPQIARYQA